MLDFRFWNFYNYVVPSAMELIKSVLNIAIDGKELPITYYQLPITNYPLPITHSTNDCFLKLLVQILEFLQYCWFRYHS